MTCKELRKHVHMCLDRRQPDSLSEEAREHVNACNKCAAFDESMRMIDSDLRQMAGTPISPELLARLHKLLDSARKPHSKMK